MDSLTNEFVEVHYCSRKCCSSPNVDDECASALRVSSGRLFASRKISVLAANASATGSTVPVLTWMKSARPHNVVLVLVCSLPETFQRCREMSPLRVLVRIGGNCSR